MRHQHVNQASSMPLNNYRCPLHPSRAPCSWPAVPGIFTFKSNSTNKTYALNTNLLDQKAAQQVCNDMGGHLASWGSYEEQMEVEQYYIKQVGGSSGCMCCDDFAMC
jgi:hypothetical protein